MRASTASDHSHHLDHCAIVVEVDRHELRLHLKPPRLEVRVDASHLLEWLRALGLELRVDDAWRGGGGGGGGDEPGAEVAVVVEVEAVAALTRADLVHQLAEHRARLERLVHRPRERHAHGLLDPPQRPLLVIAVVDVDVHRLVRRAGGGSRLADLFHSVGGGAAAAPVGGRLALLHPRVAGAQRRAEVRAVVPGDLVHRL